MANTEAPNNIFATIRFLKSDMTRSEQRIADYMLKHPIEVSSQSLAALSEKCDCGQATIIRFCRKIGCSSFVEVKELLAEQPQEESQTASGISLDKTSSVKDLAQGITSLYLKTLQETMDLNFTENFEIASRKIASAHAIYLFGCGDALVPCMCAYYRFSRIGIPTFFAQEADMQLIQAANIRSDDVVIAISHSGKTRHVIHALQSAHEAGAFVIGITQTSKSPMTNFCDLLFFNATSDITVGKTLVAHRLAENTIIEILYAAVVSLMPEQANQVLKKSARLLTANKVDNG